MNGANIFVELAKTWQREPKGGTMVLMGYLIALALVFLVSLAWHDLPAGDAGCPETTGIHKREDDPQLSHPLNS